MTGPHYHGGMGTRLGGRADDDGKIPRVVRGTILRFYVMIAADYTWDDFT